MARYAVVESGTVTNVIEWDGSPHANSASFVAAEGEADAQIGATYNGSAFSYTAPAAPEPTAAQVQEAADKTSGHDKLVALGLTADEIAALGIK
jgi:L-serine deaminase